jgi:hypothetical protein
MMTKEQKISYAYGYWLKMAKMGNVIGCISDETVRKSLEAMIVLCDNEQEIRCHVTGFVWGIMKCEKLLKDTI